MEYVTIIDLQNGDTIFASILCKNYAGLETMATSGPVVMVTTPPDVTLAVINIGW